MNIKNILLNIFKEDLSEDNEDETISDQLLLDMVKHFADELIIDLCVCNGSCDNCLDLKKVKVSFDNETINAEVPENIKENIKKKLKKKEIIVKIKLD